MRGAGRARAIIRHLERAYPDAACALRFTTPLELLVATILSAQCTDERVNLVTSALFRKYRRAEDYAARRPGDLRGRDPVDGLLPGQDAVDAGHGPEPSSIATAARCRGRWRRLTALPGVGRKTANVVLGNAFGVPGIAVDTHVFRVTQRLGLSRGPRIPTRSKLSWPRSCPAPAGPGSAT